MFNGFQGVLYRELNVFRKRAKKQIVASSLSPLLFLIAFGWGFGDRVAVDGLPYITFLIPGLISMSSLNQSFAIAQELNITRFYFHVFDEFLIAPISHVEIVLGEAAYGMFKGLLSTALIFAYSVIFSVKLIIGPMFFLAILAHTFLFATLGITVAMLVRDHGDQATVNTFVITPMIFLSGTFFPVDKLPAVFKWLVYALPLTYSTKVIRATLTGGDVNILYFLLMTGFAAAFFLTALWALRRVEG
ncbi:MAG TPA: ABC transporter permease [Nitrospirae bacterium]|nr:ABC transporter permease [Nitrospirota bacterium]HDZ01586.1 ABC transporter permease [Nitrospirota bacterium]